MEMLMAMLMGLGEDASYDVRADGSVHVTLEDFEGFDDDWHEVDREYDDESAVESFVEWLESASLSHEGDFYCVYHFEGFDVVLGYASYDV